MKENDFLDAMSNVDDDVLERFVSMDNELQKKANIRAKSKNVWLRVGIIAACMVLVFSLITMIAISLREEDPNVVPNPDKITDYTDESESGTINDSTASSGQEDTDNQGSDDPSIVLPENNA